MLQNVHLVLLYTNDERAMGDMKGFVLVHKALDLHLRLHNRTIDNCGDCLLINSIQDQIMHTLCATFSLLCPFRHNSFFSLIIFWIRSATSLADVLDASINIPSSIPGMLGLASSVFFSADSFDFLRFFPLPFLLPVEHKQSIKIKRGVSCGGILECSLSKYDLNSEGFRLLVK